MFTSSSGQRLIEVFAGPLDEAKILISRGDIVAAIPILSRALNDEFWHEEALLMLGACHLSVGNNGLGAVLSSAAIDARSARTGKPYLEAMMNLGAAHKAEHHNDDAGKVWRDALRHETDRGERAKFMVNIAGLYVNEGDPGRAIEWCDRALREDPNCVKARVQRGLACLELGRWREGWEGWKHTYAAGDRSRKNYGGLPDWDGSPGQHVIVYGDQGIGDEIWGAACLADMQRQSRQITLDCHPRLEALFRRSFPEIAVHGTRKDLSHLPWLAGCDADATVCLADLPGFFRNAGEWDGLPYLKSDTTLGPKWHHSEPPECERYPRRIGVSWTGGTKRTREDLRSLPLAALAPILRSRPDAQWFSLQYTPNAARDVCELEEKTGIRVAHYPGWVECYDYDRTASFVASLDLVITVCTTVHHLAGALGVPCWTLVPSRASWRYQASGETLPWYGSVRLFRQERDGDWSGVVDCVAGELADLI